MAEYMKKPCAHCPYRRDVKPYLHPKRGEQLAYHATNYYNDFPCHLTTEEDEEDTGQRAVTENSKQCAGFLTLMANECGEGRIPDGFVPSYELVYNDASEMAYYYENPDEHEPGI